MLPKQAVSRAKQRSMLHCNADAPKPGSLKNYRMAGMSVLFR
jgi:hypothetical protein